MSIKVVLLDIEGTTTPITFVHDTLFPYAREHLAEFLHEHAQQADVKALLREVESIAGHSLTLEQSIEQLQQWIDQDQKVTPLKTLQGMIWRQGYESGQLKGAFYVDAVEALRRWHAQSIKLYIYSSGSVEAQKLIFGYPDSGDLTPMLSGYFDTHIGGKREADSYRKIIEELGFAADEIVFFSDVAEELDAASQTGMQTYQLIRDELAVPSPAHQQLRDFNGIDFR